MPHENALEMQDVAEDFRKAIFDTYQTHQTLTGTQDQLLFQLVLEKFAERTADKGGKFTVPLLFNGEPLEVEVSIVLKARRQENLSEVQGSTLDAIATVLAVRPEPNGTVFYDIVHEGRTTVQVAFGYVNGPLGFSVHQDGTHVSDGDYDKSYGTETEWARAVVEAAKVYKGKFWMGEVPKTCQLCQKQITTEFVDGKTRMGPWANMCVGCHVLDGYGLGTGKGQRYKKQADGRFFKIGG